jgi:hypothetical protein
MFSRKHTRKVTDELCNQLHQTKAQRNSVQKQRQKAHSKKIGASKAADHLTTR